MKKRTVVFLELSVVFSLSSCSSLSDRQSTVALFDTTVTVSLFSAPDGVLEPIGDYLNDLDKEMDAYTVPQAGITSVYTLNHTNEAVIVSDGLFEALRFAMEIQKATEGFFNPLIGAVAELWKQEVLQAQNPTVDNVSRVKAALPTLLEDIKDSSLILDEKKKTVQRLGKAKIDLGAFGKGYALRWVRNFLIRSSVSSYLVNAGSSSFLIGKTKSGGDWSIHFKDDDGQAHVLLKDTALATSSVSEQARTIDGTIYSHIVNPFTGDAVCAHTMVTVVGDDPGLDDVLSTAFMVAGADKATSLASALGEAGYSPVRFAFFTKNSSGNGGVWDSSNTLKVEN